ncbi:unnamed protein product [Ectocarpus sp. 12 AP-2014]
MILCERWTCILPVVGVAVLATSGVKTGGNHEEGVVRLFAHGGDLRMRHTTTDAFSQADTSVSTILTGEAERARRDTSCNPHENLSLQSRETSIEDKQLVTNPKVLD